MVRSAAENFDFGSLPSGTRERFLLLIALAALGCQDITIYLVILIDGYFPGQIYAYFWYFLAVVGLFLTLTAFSYGSHRRTIMRRFGLSGPLPSDLEATCRKLANEAQLKNVDFEITSKFLQQDAIACGFPCKRKVILGGGMAILQKKRPDLFDAVLGHELSHIRNRDVDIGYLSRAVYCAILILGMLVVGFGSLRLLFEFYRNSPADIIRLAYAVYIERSYPQTPYEIKWITNSLIALASAFSSIAEILLLSTIHYVTLLRSREHYADLGGCFLLGSDKMLSVINGAKRSSSDKFASRLFRLHPSPEARRSVIAHPFKLLMPAKAEVIFTGYVSGILIQAMFAMGLLRNSGGYAEYLRDSGASLANIGKAAAPIVLFALLLAVLGSQGLRLCIAEGLAPRARFTVYVLRSIVTVVLTVFGFAIGCLGNQSAIANYMTGHFDRLYGFDFSKLVIIGMSALLASLVFGAYFRTLFPIRQMTRLGAIRHFLLLLWVFLSLQIVGVLFTWLGTEFANDPARIPMLSVSLLYVTIALLVMLSISLIIRWRIARWAARTALSQA